MRVNHLSLSNFRNYGRLELPLSAGPTLLFGKNAQGKTNLLEAVHYLATTRSPLAPRDNQLVSWEASGKDTPISVGRLVADIALAGSHRHLEMRLIIERNGRGQPGFRREALVNRRKVRLMDLLGQLQVVLFLPEDVALVTGPPSERRRYLDITICQVDRHYCRTLAHYNKVLEQRNALLRQLAEGHGSLEFLEILTEKLVDLGKDILVRRATFFATISPQVQRIHFEELTDGRESLQLTYLPRLQARINGANGQDQLPDWSWLGANRQDSPAVGLRLAEQLDASRTEDIARGATTVGPHRDDWHFLVNGRSLSDYGSRGQQRSAILALKMAQIDWMTDFSGESPVLLLDEVLAELDELRRRQLLLYVLKAEQAILTATDPAMFSTEFLKTATCLEVKQGSIRKAARPESYSPS